METQTRPTRVRIRKEPSDEPIGDRRPKKRVKVSIPVELLPMARKQTKAKVFEEERKTSSLGKDETHVLFLELKNRRKENEELKKKLSEGKEILVSICTTCFQELTIAGYKVYRENICPIET